MKVRNSDDFRRIVRQKRKDEGLSQQELAERTGLARQTISDFETGRNNVSLTTAFQCLRALDGSFDASFAQSDSSQSTGADDRTFGAGGMR